MRRRSAGSRAGAARTARASVAAKGDISTPGKRRLILASTHAMRLHLPAWARSRLDSPGMTRQIRACSMLRLAANPPTAVTPALCALFFASGAAALLFENLWFRQAGLLLGNAVWTSDLVTAGFMAGLRVGNGFVAHRAWRWRRPLRAYAGLEILIAASGLALVAGLPGLVPAVAPLLARLGEGALLDAVRLAGGFLLLVVPSSAMGATLPVLARSLGVHDP